MATITPSAAFLRRLIPAIAVEVVVVAVCAIAYAMTENLLWFVGVGIAMVGFIAWTVYQVVMHRGEWRWYDGTPGTGKKT